MCAIQWVATAAVLTCDTLTIKLPHLATPRYATKAETNFWLRIPTNNQQPLTIHGIAVRTASCCHVTSVMPLVPQTSPSDNLYWSKQLEIHYMTLGIGTWNVSELFRRHTGEFWRQTQLMRGLDALPHRVFQPSKKKVSWDKEMKIEIIIIIKKLRGLSPRANYTDRAAAAGRRS